MKNLITFVIISTLCIMAFMTIISEIIRIENPFYKGIAVVLLLIVFQMIDTFSKVIKK